MGMDPISWVAIAAVVGAGISAAGSIEGGINQKKTEDAQASAQRQTAISTENVGAQQAADQQLKARRLQATQAATAGAGGVDPTTGTPLELQGQTAEFGELDSLRIINNAQMSAWGYNQQAAITENQGQNAQTSGFIQGGATLLGGASSAYFSANSPKFNAPSTT